MAKQKAVFHLAGKAYSVKERIRENVRYIVDAVPNDVPLTGKFFNFMRDLFTYHPRSEEKIAGGIEEIVVRQAARNPKNREFWIRTTGSDAEWTDISWPECLKATTPFNQFSGACRLAVKPDTQAFCEAQFSASELTTLTCPLTGQSFDREHAHVDHDSPWPFQNIVQEFVANEGLDLGQIEYDGLERGSTFVTLRDRDLAARFVRFHNEVARLRVVSAAGHLRRTRKSAGD